MFFPAHVAAGLIVGKLTDNYAASLIGAAAIDVDHIISYLRSGILFKPKKLIAAITDTSDPWGDQRHFLHNVFSWIIISALISIVDFNVGLAFGLAYLSHLILDALDDSDFFPFFPNKKINLRGPIHYFSKPEISFTVFLFLTFLIL